MVKKPRELKSDKFTVFITPKGKEGNVPNVTLTYNNTGESIGSITMKEIIPKILEWSKNLKNLSMEERKEWDQYYLKDYSN